MRGIESAAFVATDLLLAGYEPLLCILDDLVILTSKLGMRTRPVMASSFTWDVCHGPALSDIPSLANAALQVRGKTKKRLGIPRGTAAGPRISELIFRRFGMSGVFR